MGTVSIALGYFGPLVVTPQANQVPLFDIFITGPIGFFAGLAWGVWCEARRACLVPVA